jgi:primosomal protein N'
LLATLGAATSESLIIDTAEPQHPVYQALAHSDPKILYDAERDDRKRFLYPPFGEVVSITLRTASPEIGTRLKEILPRATYTVSQKNIIIHAPKGTNFSAIWSVLPDDAIVDHNAPTLL